MKGTLLYLAIILEGFRYYNFISHLPDSLITVNIISRWYLRLLARAVGWLLEIPARRSAVQISFPFRPAPGLMQDVCDCDEPRIWYAWRLVVSNHHFQWDDFGVHNRITVSDIVLLTI